MVFTMIPTIGDPRDLPELPFVRQLVQAATLEEARCRACWVVGSLQLRRGAHEVTPSAAPTSRSLFLPVIWMNPRPSKRTPSPGCVFPRSSRPSQAASPDALGQAVRVALARAAW